MPEMEGHRLGRDVNFGGYIWRDVRTGGFFLDTELEDLEYSDEDTEDNYGTPQTTFSLGELPVRKEKRRVKKRVFEDWVIV